MRIFVVEQNGQGGLAHYAYQICTALAEGDADVTLITARDYELKDFHHNFYLDNRLRMWQLFDPRSSEITYTRSLMEIWRRVLWTFRRGRRAMRLIIMWIGLTNHLLRQKPDIVQFGKINFPFEAFFLARLKKKGLVLTQVNHEFERRESSGLLSRQVDKLYTNIYENFSAIFFHARENRERFHSLMNVPREITHIIPHGNERFFLTQAAKTGKHVDLRKHFGLQDDELVVLFFGVIAPSKGLPDLIDAFAQVASKSPAKLIVSGYPSKYIDINEIQRQIDGLGIHDRVILDMRYIPIEEVAPLLKLSTVVALPYHNSTQSGALQVAYTFGRPVIATSVGGLPEAIEDGKSGFLVPPHAPELLAEKILILLNDASLTHSMGEYAQRLSETRYSWTPIGARVLEVYQQLLSRASSA
jgi:glycosyltransferase involved in cell wall biosynthesis